MRKSKPKKRYFLPDPIFKDTLVTQFVNNLMKDVQKFLKFIENEFDFTTEYPFNSIYDWLEKETCEECIEYIVSIMMEPYSEITEPLVKEIRIATNHLNNILSTIDDKETLNDIKLTINSARSIFNKIDDMSDDLEKLSKDKELTKSIRDLTIGLSKFLNEIYP